MMSKVIVVPVEVLIAGILLCVDSFPISSALTQDLTSWCNNASFPYKPFGKMIVTQKPCKEVCSADLTDPNGVEFCLLNCREFWLTCIVASGVRNNTLAADGISSTVGTVISSSNAFPVGVADTRIYVALFVVVVVGMAVLAVGCFMNVCCKSHVTRRMSKKTNGLVAASETPLNEGSTNTSDDSRVNICNVCRGQGLCSYCSVRSGPFDFRTSPNGSLMMPNS